VHTGHIVVGFKAAEMVLLIFLVGALLGILIGGAVCVRYLRQEVAASVGPRLQRMQVQLDTIESAVNLALVTRHAELSTRPPDDPAR
jgi:hypothetical protein